MQAERALLPELDRERHEPVARPVRRARHFADREFHRIDRHGLLEGKAAFERRRLLARPGAYLRLLGARSEIGVGLFIADPLDAAAQAHLPVHRLPIEYQCRLRMDIQLAPFLTVYVGVE